MNAPLVSQVSKFAFAALFAASGAWAATDSLVQEQKTLYENLRDMDFSNPGVAINGELRGKFISSVLDTNGPSKNTEIGAATEGDFVIQARPTKDTRATVMFRAHQDWQKSHEEGISPFLFDWFSYDGYTFGKKLRFSLGDMRVAYTPLTLETPRLEVLQEPELLQKKREDVMAYRHLDGSNGRLLQGLNADFHSGSIAFLDDIAVQSTVSRLRNQAKKIDQIFYDFDESDRYMLGSQLGLSSYGFNVGAAYVNSFDRLASAENFFNTTMASDTIGIENNSVMSFSGGVDIARLMQTKAFDFTFGVEYAMSNYAQTLLVNGKDFVSKKILDSNLVGIGELPVMAHYVVYTDINSTADVLYKQPELNGKALLAKMQGGINNSAVEASMVLRLLKNDKNFQSDLAESPTYLGSTIVLNSSAFNQTDSVLNMLRAGTMENLYFARYENNPLQKINLVSGDTNEVGEQFLLNNYKKAHFIRTGFTNAPLVRSEFANASLDPAVNLALPYGFATPDRTGVSADVDVLTLNKSLELNGRFNMLNQDALNASYLTLGFGAGMQFGKFLELKRIINVNAAFENAKESKGFERSSTRMSVGTRLGVWGQLCLLGAYQSIEKDYGILLAGAKGTETILLFGPEYQIATGSYVSFQYGMLSNELDLGGVKTTLDRNLIAADVRVKF